MKFSLSRALTLLVISFTFLLAATSCKKSNSSNPNGGMSASVSGTAWSANYPIAGIYSSGIGEFVIGGLQFKGGDSTVFEISVFTPFTLNRAINSDTTNDDIQYVDTKTGQAYDGGQSSGWSILTVTSYDSTGHKIGGTFKGVLYNVSGGSDSLTITNGSFSTSYTP